MGKFGATPEEVGLDQSTYVVHGALLASVGVFIFAVAFIVIGGVTMVMAGIGRLSVPTHFSKSSSIISQPTLAPAGTHVWSRGDIGSIRRKTAGTVLGVSLLTYLSFALNPGYVANPFSPQSGSTAWFVFLFAIFCAVFWVLAQWRWIACALIGAIVVVGTTVTSAQSIGERLARDVITDRPTPLPLSYFALQGDVVQVQILGSDSSSTSTSGSSAEDAASAVPSCLYLLGHSDGVLLLTNGYRLYRVNDWAVVLVQNGSGTACAVH